MWFPAWLHGLAIAMLALGCLCALVLLIQVIRRPQKMAAINVVWPVCALFGSVLVVVAHARLAEPSGPTGKRGRTPVATVIAKGALHCGSGCTLGDLAAE